MAQYLIGNGPMPTTAQFLGVTTGTAIKTMLQVKPSATIGAKIIQWGVSWDGHASNTGLQIELCQTDVAATVTAAVAADIMKYDAAALMGGDPTTNLIQVGTTSTGYTGTAEGTITAVRVFDLPQYVYAIQPGSYNMQFPLGREPFIEISKFARIRVTAAGNAVNVKCYMLIEV